MRARYLLSALICLWMLSACGGGGSSSPEALSLDPQSTALVVGETQSFTAFAQGGGNVPLVWSVSGGANPGSIDQTGDYTAPMVPGNYTVRVAFSTDPSIFAEAQVNVVGEPEVVVFNGDFVPPLITQSRFTFRATVVGFDNERIDWSATGGSVSDGTYVAPTIPGTYTVTARSAENPSVFETVQVEVVDAVNARMTIAGKGDILVRLNNDEAPRTVANFVSLINEGFYDNTRFHRYGPDETPPLDIVQGGDPLSKVLPVDDPQVGTGGPGYTIDFEDNNLLHEPFAIAMARSSDPDSAGSQFYFARSALPSLDGNYVVFGKAIEGTDVLLSLREGDRVVDMVVEPR